MRVLLRTVLLIGLACSLVRAAKADEKTYEMIVGPLLLRHCTACHTGDEPKANFSIDRLDGKHVARQRGKWQKIAARLRAGEMPPANRVQPQPADVKAVLNWIDASLARAAASRPKDPGQVTIRRLNRTEYRNTVRDLVGVDYAGAEDFPVDHLGYGFDNIGDVLSVSPLLVEKYMAAAQEIAQKAIVVPEESPRLRQHFPAEQLTGGDMMGGARALWTVGHVAARGHFPRDGQYLLVAEAFGRQGGDEPVKMTFHLGGKKFKTVAVEAIETSPDRYAAEIAVEAGRHFFGVEFINDHYQTQPIVEDRNLYVRSLEIVGPLADFHAQTPERHRRIVFRRPQSKTDHGTCARQVLEPLVSRAYRRPAAVEEVTRLVKLVEQVEAGGGSFEQGIRVALQAILVSPKFLFRGEPSKTAGGNEAVRPLTEFELAARLSYFLWSSMPDEELFNAAHAGVLRRDLKKHVRRMLADPKSRALAENFGGQWLETRRLANVSPDPKLFPNFDDALREAMRTETMLFFDAIVREDRSIFDFLNGRFTFVNERLAQHYGIEGVRGEEFRRVDLSDTVRAGVLTHGSVLVVTSNPNRTSPVKRGKWILDQMLGEAPPPPPPDTPSLADAGPSPTGTLRERMKMHIANQACASCHRRMDPLGFAMENFDAVGKWRTHDGKFTIDSKASIDGRQLDGVAGVRKMLLQRKDRIRENLVEKMLIYALGRGLEIYDRPVIEKICRQVADGDNRFLTLVEAVVASYPFQNCRGKVGGKP